MFLHDGVAGCPSESTKQSQHKNNNDIKTFVSSFLCVCVRSETNFFNAVFQFNFNYSVVDLSEST